MKTLFLAAAALALAAAGAPRAGHVRPDISYRDGAETFDNPARGVAGGGWVTFSPEGLPNWRGQGGFRSSLWELSRFSGGREQGGKRPPAERVGGRDIPLTEAMLGDVRRFLRETREKGGALIVRLGYTWSEHPGCEPADFDVLLGHVAALSGVLADFDDVVVAVEAGVAGPWGEMHSSDYCAAESMNRILKTYVDGLGPRIPVLVRSPAYFGKLAGTTSAEELLSRLPFADGRLKRLGMYNDGYLGTWWDYGTWAGDFTRERGVRLLAANPDAPYGGELAYVGRDWLEKNMKVFDPAQWNLPREWYETHLTYLRNLGERGHTLADFLSDGLTFTTNAYRWAGMPDLAEYDGTDMNKFVRDHMGYRLVVRDARVPRRLERDAKTRPFAAVELENTGFAKPLLPLGAEVLLVRDGRAVASAAFAPKGFDLGGGRRSRLKLPLQGLDVSRLPAGECELHLRLSMPCKDEKPGEGAPRRAIRLANAGVWNAALGSNRLGTLALGGKARQPAARSASASDRGDAFTDEEPIALDLGGGTRTVKTWKQAKWNGQPLSVDNGRLVFTEDVGVHGGMIDVGAKGELVFARGCAIGTGLGDAGTRVFALAPGARLRMEGNAWRHDHTRVVVPAGAEWTADITRLALCGSMKDSLWDVSGRAVLLRGIDVAEAKWGPRLTVRLRPGGELFLGGAVSTNGEKCGLEVTLEGGTLTLFWDARLDPGLVKVAPGAKVEVRVAKGVAFDPSALEKGEGASVRVRRDVPVGIDLPARYAFDVRYDRTGRSYWISADSFREKVALFRVRYPNPDCESPARFETETVGDTVFRRRFPAGDGPWTVRAEVRDVHGETFATNIVVRRPANAVRAPAPNDLVLVGQTGYGEALDLAADVFEKDLCNLYVGWKTIWKTLPDAWPEDKRAEWAKIAKDRKMWSMSIYAPPSPDLAEKLEEAYGSRYLGNNAGEYASFMYQGRENCGIPMNVDLKTARDRFVNRFIANAGFGWMSRFPWMFSTCGAAISCYELAGGIDFICNEQWAIGAQNIAHTSAEARGAARKWKPEYWCAWNAHEWQTCAIPYRMAQKYDSCLVGFLQEYVFGTSIIVLESGAQGKQAWKYTSDTPGQPAEERAEEGYDGYVAERYRAVTKRFYDWVKANPRDKGSPETKIAMALGNLDGYLGQNGGFTVWSQHDNAVTNAALWKYGAPENSQAMMEDLFFPRPAELMAPFRNTWIGGTPYGQVDVMQIDDESTVADLRRYALLTFGGWNTMTPHVKDVLERYVREGGVLVMSRPELTTRVDRDFKNYTDGDLLAPFDFLPPEGKPGEHVEKKVGRGRYFLFTARQFPSEDKAARAAYEALVDRLARSVEQTVKIAGVPSDADSPKAIVYGVYPTKAYFLNADTVRPRTFACESGGVRREITLGPCEIRAMTLDELRKP